MMELEGIDRPPTESLDDRRRRWAHLLSSRHYEPVVSDVLSDELSKYMNSCVIDPTDIVSHMRECALILASAPSIFFAAVEGNLVSRMITDAVIQADYTTIQQRAHHQPSIYIHFLTDDEGNAPTATQYSIILNTIREYLHQGAVNAHHIDNITPPFVPVEASIRGFRKYLHTPAADRSPRRIAALERLCAGIVLRCSSILPHLQDAPLPYPPAEVGYALHAHSRLAQHRARHSSNYIMNLVEDICIHLFRTGVLTQKFSMHQFIIYLIFRPSQAAIAEIFCSGLLQCWVDGGGGFNAYPAGRSVASSRSVDAEAWREHELLARQGSPLEERMMVLRERANVWRNALDWDVVKEGTTEEGKAEKHKSGGDGMDMSQV